MHAADRNTNCVQHNKTHVDKSVRCRANPRPRTHTMTENGARVSEPRHEPKLKTWVPGSKYHAPHKTMYADKRARDSSTLEATCSHENPDMMGVSGLCHKTMNNTRPKWQNPDTFTLIYTPPPAARGCWYVRKQYTPLSLLEIILPPNEERKRTSCEVHRCLY